MDKLFLSERVEIENNCHENEKPKEMEIGLMFISIRKVFKT